MNYTDNSKKNKKLIHFKFYTQITLTHVSIYDVIKAYLSLIFESMLCASHINNHITYDMISNHFICYLVRYFTFQVHNI